LVDTGILVYIPIIIAGFALAAFALGETRGTLLLNLVQLGSLGILFVRDSLFGGAGIGKRMTGLQVVQTKDGKTPLTYGQGVVRWLSQFIPIFNLADAVAPYYDPLFRRYGDRWAGTRVIDTERKLAKARESIERRLIKKGVQPAPPKFGITME